MPEPVDDACDQLTWPTCHFREVGDRPWPTRAMAVRMDEKRQMARPVTDAVGLTVGVQIVCPDCGGTRRVPRGDCLGDAMNTTFHGAGTRGTYWSGRDA